MLSQGQYFVQQRNKAYNKIVDYYLCNSNYQESRKMVVQISSKNGNTRWRNVIKAFCQRWKVNKCAI